MSLVAPKLPEEVEAERNLENGRTEAAFSSLKQALDIVIRFNIPSSDPFPLRVFSSIVPLLELHGDDATIKQLLETENQQWIDRQQRSLLQRLSVEAKLNRGQWQSALDDLSGSLAADSLFPESLRTSLTVDGLVGRAERTGEAKDLDEIEKLIDHLEGLVVESSPVLDGDDVLTGTSSLRLQVTKAEVLEKKGRVKMLKKEPEKALLLFLDELKELGVEPAVLERMDISKAVEGRKDEHYPFSSLRLIEAGIRTGQSLIGLNELNRAEEVLSASLNWSEKKSSQDQWKTINTQTFKAEILAIQSLTGLGRCLVSRKVPVYAEGIFRNAIEKSEAILASHPVLTARVRHEISPTKVLYAGVLRSMGRDRKADEVLRSISDVDD